MNIKTKLYISISIIILLIVLILISFLVSTKSITQERDNIIIAGDITSKVIDLNSLTTDFLLNPDDRVVQQWDLSFNSGLQLFEKSDEEKVQMLKEEYIVLDSTFQNVVKNFHEEITLKDSGASEDEIEFIQELRNSLVSQLSIASRSITQASTAFEDNKRDTLVQVENRNIRVTTFSLFILLTCVCIISIVMVRAITTPLSEMLRVSKSFGQGKLKARVTLNTGDEFQLLGDSMNTMALNLRKQAIKTEKIQQEKVILASEDHKILQKKIDELERWKKLTIGRELRMKELKQENTDLRKGVKKDSKSGKEQNWAI